MAPSKETPDLPPGAPRLGAAMFARIAPRYALLNRLLSLGFDGRWRRFAAGQTRLRAGDRALDVCTGTGDFAFELERRTGRRGRGIGLGLTRGRPRVGRG